MFRHESGWWVPEGEWEAFGPMKKSPGRVGGRLLYQWSKIERALRYTPGRDVIVDVGAHVGFWSWVLAGEFTMLHAFEPMPEFRACYEKNMADRNNWTLHPVALGSRPGRVVMDWPPGISGGTHVLADGPDVQSEIEMHRLDDYGFEHIDLLKIDTEGFESFIIEGARETLQRCRPVIVVEQKPGHAMGYGKDDRQAVYDLEAMGFKVADHHHGDYFMVPNDCRGDWPGIDRDEGAHASIRQ